MAAMVNLPQQYLGLCAIARDEDTILREWVAWHLLIGFEKIIIYDNGSKTPVCEVLEDFLDTGLVETYTINGEQRQLTAYAHCLRERGREFRHLAFFDLDEFLLLREESDARLLVSDFAEYGALSLNVAQFSSDGHLGRPKEPVTSAFCERLEISTVTKWILRPDVTDLPWSPHHFTFTAPALAVNTRGEPAVGGFVPPAVERAQLNHYPWRSQRDYEERLLRGDAVFAENPRRLESFYNQAELRGVRDEHTRRHFDRLRAKMADPAAPPYAPVRYADVAPLPPARLLKLMRACLDKGEAETALVLYSLRQDDLRQEPEAVATALEAAAAARNPFKTPVLARRLLELAPTLHSYRRCATALAALGKAEEAERLKEYVAKADRFLPADFAGR